MPRARPFAETAEDSSGTARGAGTFADLHPTEGLDSRVPCAKVWRNRASTGGQGALRGSIRGYRALWYGGIEPRAAARDARTGSR